jgi:hypothetical protein
MNMSVGAYSGARGIARADDTSAKANIATMHLIMACSPVDSINRRVLPSSSVDLNQWSGR